MADLNQVIRENQLAAVQRQRNDALNQVAQVQGQMAGLQHLLADKDREIAELKAANAKLEAAAKEPRPAATPQADQDAA